MASSSAQPPATLSESDQYLLKIWQAFLSKASNTNPEIYDNFREKCRVYQVTSSFEDQRLKSDYPWKVDPATNTGRVWAQLLARATLLSCFGVTEPRYEGFIKDYDKAHETLKQHLTQVQYSAEVDKAFQEAKSYLEVENAKLRAEVDAATEYIKVKEVNWNGMEMRGSHLDAQPARKAKDESRAEKKGSGKGLFSWFSSKK